MQLDIADLEARLRGRRRVRNSKTYAERDPKLSDEDELDKSPDLVHLASLTSFPSLVSGARLHKHPSQQAGHGEAHQAGTSIADGAGTASDDLAGYLAGSMATRALDGSSRAPATVEAFHDSAPEECALAVPLAAAALARSLNLDDLEDVAGALLKELDGN